MVQLEGQALVAGTKAAVAAAVKAGSTGKGICNDATFGPLVDSLAPTASKAILVDAARTVHTVASCQTVGQNSAQVPRDVRQLMAVGSLLKGLRLSVVTEEGPNQLAIRIEATGLPNVPAIIRTVAAAQRHQQPRARHAPFAAESQHVTEAARQGPATD